MAAVSNYLQNKLIDWLLRAQSFTPPSETWLALFTTAPTAAGGGTEVGTGLGYARAGITSALANWAGTQAASSTTASSGTSGSTSNNAQVSFGTSTSAWGTLVGIGLFDASTGGNLLFFGNLSSSQTISASNVQVYFNAAQFAITLS